ncbi:tandem-95 repeat protein [Pseudooceanicola aestuarii]|uniref:tandem-95 repeat protein n=1 Tax=Pseudooceanicola aestuarii TaxID=2697319 RepID=UPI0013D08457|nr:Ig-like domain-containing protein [Pseudooceanicola aestuarii]
MALDLSALSAKDAITAIYVGYFDRAPDPAGLSYWIGRYNEFRDGAEDGNAGMSLAQIAASFSVQDETTQEYPFFTSPNVANANVFISQVYLNLFNRVPDQEGLDYWVDQLQSNPENIGQLIINIISGAQDNGPGFNDRATVMNKIEVAADWATDAADAGIDSEPFTATTEPEAFASATNILDGVTDDAATVTAAQGETDDFIAAYQNTAPVGANTFETVNEDGILSASASASDIDADTLTYTIEAGDGPSNGTVSMNADGTYTYDSNDDFFGTDSFKYTVKDGHGGTDTGTITVTVASVNDAPVGTGGSASVAEDGSVAATVGGADTEDAAGDLAYSVATGPSNGTVTMNPNGTYTYTPDADYNGTDSFTYRVTDTDGGTGTATVSLTVGAVNDAPTGVVAASYNVDEDATLNGTLPVASDIDGDTLTYGPAAPVAANGTVTVNANGTFTYTPNADFNGTDSFTYTVTDGTVTLSETITVNVAPTNDPVVANDSTLDTFEDVAETGSVSATDIDGDTLTYSVQSQPTNGAGTVTMNADGTYTFTPTADFNGTASFTYVVIDGEGTADTGTVTINVTPVDDQLTAGIDNISGGAGNDIVVGAEGTLNAGDKIDGGAGDADMLQVFSQGNANFSGFETTGVEIIQVTSEEGPGPDEANYDLSGTDATDLRVTNSSADVDFNFADGVQVGGDTTFELTLDNLTNDPTGGDVDVDFDGRDSKTSGDDNINIRITNSTTSGMDVGTLNIDGAVETINIIVEDSAGHIRIHDLDNDGQGTGSETLNITSDLRVTMGDDDIVSNVRLEAGSVTITAPSPVNSFTLFGSNGVADHDANVTGFDHDTPDDIDTINAFGTGGVELSLADANQGVTFNGSTTGGNDWIDGSDENDVLRGFAGNDVLGGEGGADDIFGGSGDDFMSGQEGNDYILGGIGNDILLGGDGSDILNGGSGDDVIDTGSSSDVSKERVDGGMGSDKVWTRGETLVGRNTTSSAGTYDILAGGHDAAGAADTSTDVLNIVGSNSSGETDGLNDVTQFECINVIEDANSQGNGVFEFIIGSVSEFKTYNDGANNDMIVVNATNATSLDFDASVLTKGIALVGSHNDDTLEGGAGADILAANDGDDELYGNAGDDIFIFDDGELNIDDTVEGGADDDTIVIEGRGVNAILGEYVTGVETLLVENTVDPVTQKVGGFPSLFGQQKITLHADFDNGQSIHLDGSKMTASEKFTVDHAQGSLNTVQITGGADSDLFIFGDNFGADDSIDGGADTGIDSFDTDNVPASFFMTANMGDVLQLDTVNTVSDGAFANVGNVEVLDIRDGDVSLGSEAYNNGNGFKVVDGRNASSYTVDASGFGAGLIFLEGAGQADITATNFADIISLEADGDAYLDEVRAGDGDDLIKVADGTIDSNTWGSTTLDGGAGTDTVELQNESGNNIDLMVNLDTVTSIERYTLQSDGDVFDNGSFDEQHHSITFQGGNVGTVTDIEIDGSNGEAEDSLNVVIDGNNNPNGPEADVDADFSFNFTGSDGDDTLSKFNTGVNNDIDFNGGAGDDVFQIAGGDLGASTSFDGGSGDDAIDQLGGVFIDDDFISVSNVEELYSTTGAINATLGQRAENAGLTTVFGSNGDDQLTVDAAFTNALTLELDGSQEGDVGGDDMFDAGATTADITVNAVGGGDINGDDTITGGSDGGDVFNLAISDDQGATDATDLSGVTGFEALNITEITSGSPFPIESPVIDNNSVETVNLGSTGNLGDFATIVESGFESGDMLNIDGNDFDAAVNYDGSASNASGSITTDIDHDFDDSIQAGGGNDEVMVGDGEDTVEGGTGNDTVDGGAGSDDIDGGTGNDVLFGGEGQFNDTIVGGSGDDVITGGADVEGISSEGDMLTGGEGNDVFRIANVSDSSGLSHDLITDFVSGSDKILIEESVLQEVGETPGDVVFVGNAANFAQAQGAIGATANNDKLDWVFQQGNGTEAPTIWIDVNDDGVLNANDIQIEVDAGVTAMQAVDLYLDDTTAIDAPTITSVTDDTGAESDDFITNDNDAPVVRVSFSTATDGTGAQEGDTVTLTGASAPVAPIVLMAADIANGYVDFTLAAGPIADGTYALSATITDNFGATDTSAAATQDLVIDTTASIVIDDVSTDDIDDGYINAAEVSSVNASGTVSGIADGVTVTVTFSDGVNSIDQDVTVENGAWEVTGVNLTTLAEGNVTVTAEATDIAGNLATDDTSLTKDTVVGITLNIADGSVINADEEDDVTFTGNVSNEGGANVVLSASGVDASDNPVNLPLGSAGTLASFYSADRDITSAGFKEDSTVTFTATVTDAAGNTATANDTAIIDRIGPDFSITDAVFDYDAGTITFNGTFDVADIDEGNLGSGSGNGTLITWVDGSGGNVSIEQGPLGADDIEDGSTAVTATSLTVEMNSPGGSFFGDVWGFQELEAGASFGQAQIDTLTLEEGAFEDVNGNGSAEVSNIKLGLVISTDDISSTALYGGNGNDVLTASNADDTLQGNDGNDVFVVSSNVLADDAGGQPGYDTAMVITDFVAGTDKIRIDGGDLDGVLSGTSYADGTDLINFATFSSGSSTAASNVEGTIIFDEVNNQLRIDVLGNTAWTGASIDDDAFVSDTGIDDIIIDLPNLVGVVTSSDIDIAITPVP